MDKIFEGAKACFLQGLQEMQAGELNRAEASFEAALRHVPDRISSLNNLAAVRLQLGKPTEALAALSRISALEPANLAVWLQCAELQVGLNQLPQALRSLDTALALNPGAGAVWSNRGMLLRDLQRPAEAAASFARAIETGADTELNRFYLASLNGTQTASAPRAYVEQLFDSYAQDFSSHLVQALNYRGHERLVARLRERYPGRFTSALDLGCGTGLCGALIRPCTDRLEGLDISRGMVDKARQSGLYDAVTHADALDHLKAAPLTYDLIVAADVFIYVGALEAVFAAAHAALLPGGILCFTVELPVSESSDAASSGAEGAAGNVAELQLQKSLRFAHSQAYVNRAAQLAGFQVDEVVHAPIRDDQGVPIAGLLVFLSR